MKKKKFLLLLMMIVCSTWQSLAQSSWDGVAKFTQVLVWNTDGTFTAYKCADHPAVYPDSTGLVLKVNDTQVVFPLNEVRKFTFDDDQLSDIEETAQRNGTYEITQNYIKVDDLKAGTVVAIYDVNGKLAIQKQASDGSASIDISSLSHGVYVVKAGNTNFKFMKR